MQKIEFDTGLSLKGFEKDLRSAEKSLDSLRARLEKTRREADFAYDEAYRAANSGDEDLANRWSREAENKERQILKIKNEIAVAEEKAAKAAEAYAGAQDEAAKASQIEKLKTVGQDVDGVLKTITGRIKGLMKRVLFFSVITKFLNAVRSEFTRIAMQNQDLTASVGQLKAAFATLATPLINSVIPAIKAVVDWITKAVIALSMLVAKITGKSFEEMKSEAKQGAGGGAGGAKAKKQLQLAGFDTIQKLDDTSGGASAAATAAIDAMGNINDLAELTEDEFKKILEQIALVGAAIALWGNKGKIIDALAAHFPKLVEKIGQIAPALGKALSKILGWAAAVIGAFLLVGGAIEAWDKGINMDNFKSMMIGTILLIGGLYLALGPVAAGFAAMAAGVLLVVVAIKDMLDQGPNTLNSLTLLAGSISVIIGLLMTGHGWLALIMGIIVAVVALAATKGGEAENIVKHLKDTLGGFKDFFKGIFSGDIELALDGLKRGFKGLGNVFIDVWEGMVRACAKAVNAIIKKINSISFSVPDWVPFFGGNTWSPNIPLVNENYTVPRLAKGAVIPPNREFAAILGDQKSGVNIETPLETMIEAFRAAQGSQVVQVEFTGSLAELARILAPEIKVVNRVAGDPLVRQG